MNYKETLSNPALAGKFLGIGLDPVHAKIPESAKRRKGEDPNDMYEFLSQIISATSDIALAYKPNLAFFEAYGPAGTEVLIQLNKDIQNLPSRPFVIADAKRGDIGKTNESYMRLLSQFDGYTIAPYLGGNANLPFYVDQDKLAFVLCQTSNDGADEFQGLWTTSVDLSAKLSDFSPEEWYQKLKEAKHDLMPLYKRVAKNATGWGKNIGLVTGATYPENMKQVRQMIGDDRYLLIPGVGTQGGDLEATLDAGFNSKCEKIIVNSSSSILYASSGEDFAEAARREALNTHNQINAYREKRMQASYH